MKRKLLLFAFAFLLLVGCVEPAAAPAEQAPAPERTASDRFSWRSCNLPGVEGAARCGLYEVFEDRAANAGRRIALNVVVLRSLGAAPAGEPAFWLHGGPGAAATQTIGAAKGGFLESLRKNHDLVFVDQRGTGASHPLDCDLGDDPTNLAAFFGPLLPRERVRACRERLEKDADLALYTTPIAMDDLDEVRGALGYGKIDLVAASYGTIAAQVYMRRHPDHVRAAFLVGVATPGVKQPLLFAKAAQHAMDLLFEDCAADEACRAAFPNLRAELESVLARFRAGSLEVEMLDPSSRQQRTVRLTRESFVERIRLLLYTTTFARFVPLIVHRAYEKDFIPFEALALAYNPGKILARGMYMTVTCSEGVPFITDREVRTEAEGTFVGESRVRSHREACKDWPKGNILASFIEPVRSDLPVLLISGEVDGSTPPWFAATAVKSLPHARQVKIRYYGHQLDTACVWGILDAFVEKGSADNIDTSCTAQIRRPPFATELPAQLSLR